MQNPRVRMEQLEAWEQAWQAGQGYVSEATSLLAQASAARMEHRWHAAAVGYRQARSALLSAAEILAAPPEADFAAYKALNTLRAEIQQLRRVALETLSALDQRKLVEQCEQQIDEARTTLEHARVALDEERFSEARTLAQHAGALDPALSEEAEQITSGAERSAREQMRFLRVVILVVLVVTLLVIGVILGPQLLG